MMHWQSQIERVRRALADTTPITYEALLLPRDLAGNTVRRMDPPPGVVPREAAALLLLYPQDDDLWLPLTARSGKLPLHRGEVSLPGGAADPDDAGPTYTALRETHEELGVAPDIIEILGTLTSFYIPPSNFRLTPVVGFTKAPPQLVPNPTEVDAVFSVPLRQLQDPATIVVEEWTLHGQPTNVPFFALHGYKVWGATAILLSELLLRLRQVT